MTVTLHHDDLPDGFVPAATIAIDTETMGLSPVRDRLCLVQVSNGDGDVHLVKISQGGNPAPRLQQILGDPKILKLYHFGRFDIAMLYNRFEVMSAPNYCTKIASKLARTYTDKHSLRELCREILGVNISKEQQSSDWGAAELSDEQQAYAASDVLYLHQLEAHLSGMLRREGRMTLAQAAFDFLPTRVRLDLEGWPETDIFAH